MISYTRGPLRRAAVASHPPTPDESVVARTIRDLEALAPAAVRRLRSSIENPSRDDSPGIKAAEGVLDRIGVPREQKLTAGAAFAFPVELVTGLLAGFAKMAGRDLSPAEIEGVAAKLRNVTPPPEALPKPAVLGGRTDSALPQSAGVDAPPPPPAPAPKPATKRGRPKTKTDPSAPLNIPVDFLTNVEDEDLDHPADKEI